jgi:hypothetical protein
MNFYGKKLMKETQEGQLKKLATVLDRSDQFEVALMSCFPESDPMLVYPERKLGHALASILLSLEHSSVLRSAFRLEAPNSAAALLRLQFETLVRAAWLRFAATPEQAAKLDEQLRQEAQKQVEKLPHLQDMLAAVEKDAPKGLSAPLLEFNRYHRQALNSFVHGGLHALLRRQGGFSIELAIQLVTISNGLQHLAYRLLADLGGGTRMSAVTNLYLQFTDCLQIIKISDGERAV